MLEVFEEHLILNYERVTSQTQSLKKFKFQQWLEWSHLTFSKLLWSKIIGFAIHKVKFFFVEMSYSFLFTYLLILDQISIQSRSHYGVVYRFSNRSCLALSMTSITSSQGKIRCFRNSEMLRKPDGSKFRCVSVRQLRRETCKMKCMHSFVFPQRFGWLKRVSSFPLRFRKRFCYWNLLVFMINPRFLI